MADFKKIVVGLGVLSLILLAAIIALATLLGITKSNDKLCTSQACIQSANLILNNIDTTVDPCEDFNKFSCGNFLRTKRIPEDSTSIDSFTDLRNNLANGVSDVLSQPILKSEIESIKNAKRYYRSCLDEDNIEMNGENELKYIMKNIFNGWPLIDNNFNSTLSTLELLTKYRLFGTSTLFSVYVSSNPTNPKNSNIRVEQAGWFFNKKYYTQEKIVTAYKSLIKEVVRSLNPLISNLDKEVENMFELEKELGLRRLDVAERRSQPYKTFLLKEMNQIFPGFDWNAYIRSLFSGFDTIQIEDSEIILAEDSTYLANASAVFKRMDSDADNRRTLFNLIGWSFLKDKLRSLPKKFRDAYNEFEKVYSGSSIAAPRYRTCANNILNVMPYAVGRLYVEKYFDENSKKVALEMIETIRKEFKLMVNENEWMDSESKKEALLKADLIDPKIGYPDYTYNNTHLDQVLYKDYIFSISQYLNNSITASHVSFKDSFSKLRIERDRKRWISGPAVVNAFYSPELNQICFPAGILQAPFYDANVPKYLNYGGIGSVIGHEITHGFDDNGRKYDKNGVFVPDSSTGLWTNKTIQNYISQTKCIINQYSNFKAEQINMKLNGSQTQGENIADNGGIKESFRAYQKWVKDNGKESLLPGLPYNQNQLFFINYAQVWCSKITDQALEQRILNGVHSPGEFRIIGPTSNNEFFSETFKCKPNQSNNPATKCRVW